MSFGHSRESAMAHPLDADIFVDEAETLLEPDVNPATGRPYSLEDMMRDQDVFIEEEPEMLFDPSGSAAGERSLEMTTIALRNGPPPQVREAVHQSEYVTVTRGELQAMLRQERQEMQAMLNQKQRDMEAMMEQKQRETIATTKAMMSRQREMELISLVKKDQPSEEPYQYSQFSLSGEAEWYSPFGESVYTLLYMCEFCSQSFWYSVFVYGLQMATITLTLLDVVYDPIPPMVDPTVSYAQGVTIFMLLAYMSDLIEAVLKLQNGFFPEVMEKHPGATFSTWMTSCLAQLLAGLTLLATSFVLTIQADSVIELMLNLTALLFMAEIDDLGFFIAKMGFITNQLKSATLAVEDFKVPKRKTRNRLRRILYFIALVGLCTGFGILKAMQLNGDYLPTYLYVQFGDAYNPKIPFYSGILSSGNIRTGYHREYRDIGTENILLAYCLREKVWTFSEKDDPCDYFAKSSETESYDITSMPDSEWHVLDSINRLQPFDSFSLVSRDCDPKICQGNCTADGLCKCDHDHFGLDCEFSNVCPELLIDDRLPPFPPLFIDKDLYQVSPGFHLLKNPATQEYVTTYNMPVYYANKTFPANIIFFGGRRWIITSELDLINISHAFTENPGSWFFPDRTIDRLGADFHAHHQATYSPIFISDPVDFETPDYAGTPVGLNWWRVKETNETLRHYVPDLPIETIFLCQRRESCLGKPIDFCVHGFCNNETGYCDCDWTYSGERCEAQEKCYESLQPCGETRGVCDEDTGYCRCNPPWSGKLCTYAYWCVEELGKCQNGGVCESWGSCSCPKDPAITGPACEKRAHCMYFGCANGGVCSQNGQCVCRPPFQGAQCDLVNATQEEFFCAENEDCRNGNCNNETGICECEDPSSYGTLCEHQYNCSNVHNEFAFSSPPGCQNSGMCNPMTGVCACPEPYFGPDCSQLPPCVNNTDCGGLHCDVESGLCLCTVNSPWEVDRGFLGKRCERGPKWFCQEDGDCYGASTCGESGYCLCGSEFAGQFCDSVVGGMYDPDYDQSLTDLTRSIGNCGFEDPRCGRCKEANPPSYC